VGDRRRASHITFSTPSDGATGLWEKFLGFVNGSN